MSRGSVLIVEDEVLAAMGFEAQLHQAGFDRVFIASSYDKALEIYRTHRPSIAIVDINLGDGRNGLDFLAQTPGFDRVVIVSGYGPVFYREQLDRIEYEAFFEKPVDFNEVLAAITR